MSTEKEGHEKKRALEVLVKKPPDQDGSLVPEILPPRVGPIRAAIFFVVGALAGGVGALLLLGLVGFAQTYGTFTTAMATIVAALVSGGLSVIAAIIKSKP